MSINELLLKRNKLVKSISYLMADYREFLKTPCESVPIENIKYQIDFDVRELKQVDEKIKQFFNTNFMVMSSDADLLYKKVLEKQNETKPFTSADLPKYHYSMFENPIL